MTIQITKPEIEELIRQRLRSGEFRDAEDVIFQALRSSETARSKRSIDRAAAIDRLKAFGRIHKLSLGGLTIRELRDESRP